MVIELISSWLCVQSAWDCVRSIVLGIACNWKLISFPFRCARVCVCVCLAFLSLFAAFIFVRCQLNVYYLSLSLVAVAHSIQTMCSCHFRINNNETVVFLAFVICTLHTRYIDLQQKVELWNECFMMNNANSEFRVLNMRWTERRLLSFCFLATQSNKSLWYRVVSVKVSSSNAHSILESILLASAASTSNPLNSSLIYSNVLNHLSFSEISECSHIVCVIVQRCMRMLWTIQSIRRW